MNKKTLFVAVLVLVLSLSFATVSLAAASPEDAPIVLDTVEDVAIQGVASGVYLANEESTAITGAQKTEKINKIDKAKAPGKVMTLQNIVLKNADGSVYKGKATLTVVVPGVNPGDVVTVVHYKADGTVEYIPAKVLGTGKIQFTSTFSPIAIVVQTGNGVSPKTGQSQATMVWMALAVLAVAVAGVSVKKVLVK